LAQSRHVRLYDEDRQAESQRSFAKLQTVCYT
jgi:hypothetical protein